MTLQTNMKIRHQNIDIAKGLGIIFVVWAHAGFINGGIINYFHMPLFFFLSGFTFNRNNKLSEHILRRLYRLYLPFLLLNTTITLLNKPLAYIGLKSAQYLPSEYIQKLFDATLFNCPEFLVAQTWFLFALFFVDVILKVGISITGRLVSGNKQNILLLVSYFSLAILGLILLKNNIHYFYGNCDILNILLFSSIFFVTGYTSNDFVQNKKTDITLNLKAIFITCSIILITIRLLFKYTADFRSNDFSTPPLALPVAFIGIAAVLAASTLLDKTNLTLIKSSLIYIGKKTMPIFLLHTLCFKIIGLYQVHVLKKSPANLADWGNVYSTQGGWGLIYLATGLITPILIYLSLQKITLVSNTTKT